LKVERRWSDSVELIIEEERKEEMGAYCNVDVSLPPSHGVVSGQDPRFCKHVHDNVHGNIYLDPVISFHNWIVSFLESYSLVAPKKTGARYFFFYFFAFCSVLQLSLKFVDTEQFQRRVWNVFVILWNGSFPEPCYVLLFVNFLVLAFFVYVAGFASWNN